MKKLLITILLAVLPLMGGAQYPSAFAEESTYPIGECVLIRSWDSTGTISIHRTTKGDRFVYTDFATNCEIGGPPFSLLYTDSLMYLQVKDMVIVDNYLFFCGSYGIDAHGVIGYFKIPYPFCCPIILTLYEYPSDISFKKLVAYKNGLDYDVVALGSKTDIYNITADFIVPVQNILSLPSTVLMNIATMANPNTGPGCEYYHEMVLTNNYIIMAGTQNAVRLSLRATERNNILFSPLLNLQHIYGPPDELNGRVVATAMTEDSFALAYTHYEQNANTYFTFIRTFDALSMSNTHSQMFALENKIDPWDLIYSPNAQKLVLLMPDIGNQYPYSEFIRLNPNPTGAYYTASSYWKDFAFKTLDVFFTKGFISAYGKTWYYHNLFHPFPLPSAVCPNNKKIFVKDITEVTDSSGMFTLQDNTIMTRTNVLLNVNLGNIQLQCSTQYKTEETEKNHE